MSDEYAVYEYAVYMNGFPAHETYTGVEEARAAVKEDADWAYDKFDGFGMIWIGTRRLHVIVRIPGGDYVFEARRI